jgi:hypothetical protein
MRKEIQTKEEAIESVIYGNKQDFNRIFAFAEQWVKTQFKWFSSDDLKEAYYASGNPIPVQVNVYGAVFCNLSRVGLIFHHGFTKSRHKVAHGRDLKTWISKEFKLRQQQNAKTKGTLNMFEI